MALRRASRCAQLLAAIEPVGGVVGTPDVATIGFIGGFAAMTVLDNALG